MNKVTLITAFAVTLFSVAVVNAQQAGSAEKGAQTQRAVPNVAEFDKQAAQAQENIKKMQEQMEKIRQTQNPQEKQKLLEEHWTTMQSGMGMMQGMWGSGMMGCCAGGSMMGGSMMGGPMMGGHMMGWRGMRGYYSNLTPEQMKQHQYMMDQYMGMQQQMMHHMMQQQNYMRMQPSR